MAMMVLKMFRRKQEAAVESLEADCFEAVVPTDLVVLPEVFLLVDLPLGALDRPDHHQADVWTSLEALLVHS